MSLSGGIHSIKAIQRQISVVGPIVELTRKCSAWVGVQRSLVHSHKFPDRSYRPELSTAILATGATVANPSLQEVSFQGNDDEESTPFRISQSGVTSLI